MRLFELFGDNDDAAAVLRVLQGIAKKNPSMKEIPFPVLINMMRDFNLPLGSPEDFPKYLEQLKKSNKNLDRIIGEITPTGVTLKTEPEQAQKPGGPSVDSMASHAAKDINPKIG